MVNISYSDSLAGVTTDHLHGFFVGWPHPPTPDTHLRLLHGSYAVWLAKDGERVVGFISAISDGVLAAFIPNLEVLPAYQHQGIGAELVRRMLATLGSLYSIDVICDENVQPFYERVGGRRYSGMVWRNYERQGGTPSAEADG